MKSIAPLLLLIGIVPGAQAAEPVATVPAAAIEPLPDALGFGGMFAGVSNGALLCAGGTNFPGTPLAAGGAKVWSDRVFVLSSLSGKWREAGRLPRQNGYGVSAVWRNSLVVAGGGDARANFREVYLMRWDGTKLSFETLPDLPAATANGCGTVVGDTLFVAGGQETPSATSTLRRCFGLDLAEKTRAWREFPWPAGAAGRILAVAGAHDGWFYLFSGADLVPGAGGQAERHYLVDAWRYRANTGWQRLSDLPHAVAAAPTPAMEADASHLVIAGGVYPEYLATLSKTAPHPGFSRTLLAYDLVENTWSETPAPFDGPPPRVTASLARWENRFIIPGGEVAPGLRTPTILSFTFAP